MGQRSPAYLVGALPPPSRRSMYLRPKVCPPCSSAILLVYAAVACTCLFLPPPPPPFPTPSNLALSSPPPPFLLFFFFFCKPLSLQVVPLQVLCFSLAHGEERVRDPRTRLLVVMVHAEEQPGPAHWPCLLSHSPLLLMLAPICTECSVQMGLHSCLSAYCCCCLPVCPFLCESAPQGALLLLT